MKTNKKYSVKSKIIAWQVLLTSVLFSSCTNSTEKDRAEDSPTSGTLTVYCDEAFFQKIQIQMLTFESQYARTDVDLVSTTEAEAVKALYDDKCELIVIGRDLTANEKKAFKSKQYNPASSKIAVSGLVLITNKQTALNRLTQDQVVGLITRSGSTLDSLGKPINLQIVFDNNNSSIMAFVKDSIAKGRPFSDNCSSLGTTRQAIQYVQTTKNAIALIDFSWLSDQDDSLYKATRDDIRIVAVETFTTGQFALPSQSSFKLNTYPYRRTLHAFRKTGNFTLAKGFESYLAGPKGQLTFLKQGLLPTRQGERSVHINLE